MRTLADVIKFVNEYWDYYADYLRNPTIPTNWGLFRFFQYGELPDNTTSTGDYE